MRMRLRFLSSSRFAHHLSYCRGACDWCSGDSGHRALALAQETELPLHSNRGQHLGTFGAAGERCSLRGARPKYTPLERSEEHTSELQSLRHLVCRLLLEKKK